MEDEAAGVQYNQLFQLERHGWLLLEWSMMMKTLRYI